MMEHEPVVAALYEGRRVLIEWYVEHDGERWTTSWSTFYRDADGRHRWLGSTGTTEFGLWNDDEILDAGPLNWLRMVERLAHTPTPHPDD